MHLSQLKFQKMDELFRLSFREIEVLSCMAKGLTSAQIAYSLKISIKTVETHRKNLQRKFNAVNACQLIYKAAKADVI
jgi:DNA-binding CsgD family transcriptional regulator